MTPRKITPRKTPMTPTERREDRPSGRPGEFVRRGLESLRAQIDPERAKQAALAKMTPEQREQYLENEKAYLRDRKAKLEKSKDKLTDDEIRDSDAYRQLGGNKRNTVEDFMRLKARVERAPESENRNNTLRALDLLIRERKARGSR